MQIDLESLFEKRIEDKKPFQIVFSYQSEQDLSQLSKPMQFQVMDGLGNLPQALSSADPDSIGKAERDNRNIYRFRYKEFRIYFEKTDHGVLIHRILLKNTLADFLLRSNLVFSESSP